MIKQLIKIKISQINPLFISYLYFLIITKASRSCDMAYDKQSNKINMISVLLQDTFKVFCLGLKSYYHILNLKKLHE